MIVAGLNQLMKNTDIRERLEKVLSQLRNVPIVGEIYDQNHSDSHLSADVELCEIIKLLGE
jgi:hypothetical protein